MKIIFLDIDGVLNSGRSVLAYSYKQKDYKEKEDPYFKKHTKCTIDEVSVGLLNRVLRDCDAHIVLSSSHRSHFPEGENKNILIQEYLTFLGVHWERCVGYTPGGGGFRGTQIEEWLDKNSEKFKIENILILDDSSDFTEEQKQFHVHCKGGHGITEENYFQMLKIFGINSSGIIF